MGNSPVLVLICTIDNGELEKKFQRMLKGDELEKKFQRAQEVFDRWEKAKKKNCSDASSDDDSS